MVAMRPLFPDRPLLPGRGPQRADRQLEFTQIDIEMSFIDREDFFALNEGLMESLFALIGRKVERPFRRLPYAEAMEKFGSDKPGPEGAPSKCTISRRRDGTARRKSSRPSLARGR